MGANGAGKTTTLRAISGLVKVLSGTITLDGADLAGVSPTARARGGIAHVPEGRGIFFGLTVAEHFRIGDASESRAPRRGPLALPRPAAAAGPPRRASSPAASSRCSRSRAR